MTTRIDERLRRDASELDALAVSDASRHALAHRIAATRQVADAHERPPAAPTWLPAAVAALVLVALATLMWWPPGDVEPPPVATATVPEPRLTPRVGLPAADALRSQIPLQQVSQAAPLEAEWVALREDWERARDRIERDMPVRF